MSHSHQNTFWRGYKKLQVNLTENVKDRGLDPEIYEHTIIPVKTEAIRKEHLTFMLYFWHFLPPKFERLIKYAYIHLCLWQCLPVLNTRWTGPWSWQVGNSSTIPVTLSPTPRDRSSAMVESFSHQYAVIMQPHARWAGCLNSSVGQKPRTKGGLCYPWMKAITQAGMARHWQRYTGDSFRAWQSCRAGIKA